MTTLKESIHINAEPDRAFEILISIFSAQETYRAWHKEHVRCQWLNGKPFETGSVLYIEEYLHEKLHKFRLISIQDKRNRKMKYKFMFPASFVFYEGSFSMDAEGEGCIFTATLSSRMGWLYSLFFKDRVDAIKRHMKEEGENLKNIIEKRGT